MYPPALLSASLRTRLISSSEGAAPACSVKSATSAQSSSSPSIPDIPSSAGVALPSSALCGSCRRELGHRAHLSGARPHAGRRFCSLRWRALRAPTTAPAAPIVIGEVGRGAELVI